GCSLQKRTISSSGPHFFYAGRNPDSLHLLQAENSSSLVLTSHLDGTVTSQVGPDLYVAGTHIAPSFRTTCARKCSHAGSSGREILGGNSELIVPTAANLRN